MKFSACFLILLTLSLLSTNLVLANLSLDEVTLTKKLTPVFLKQKVKLTKIEIKNKTYATYFLDLPWDPNLGHNSKETHLVYYEIMKASGCNDFSIYSLQDEQEIKLTLKMDKEKECVIEENIQPRTQKASK